MGFFDRLASKKPTTPAPSGTPQPEAAPDVPAPGSPLNVKNQLLLAREKLEAKDLPGAVAIYDELLKNAGDRPDVLVAISGDLGSCGYLEPIVELIAPRYDAEKHGPATGLNLLQAYLSLGNSEAAQHLLDILFALKRPELEERLYGFSNALGELIEKQRRGLEPTPTPTHGAPPAEQPQVVSLVTFSKPIWVYGLETLPGVLPAEKTNRVRRVAFAQLAILGLANPAEEAKKPDNELARLSRGLPLWFAEMFSFAPHYAPIAALGVLRQERFALFPSEWTTKNLGELVASSGEPIDYVFTGALRQNGELTELRLRLWEMKKMKERKLFIAQWTPATAAAELAKLGETLRMFMEWAAYPAGSTLEYTFPKEPAAWSETLAASAAFFLADKGILPAASLSEPAAALGQAGQLAASSPIASLAFLTLIDRSRRLQVPAEAIPDAPLFEAPVVQEAGGALGL